MRRIERWCHRLDSGKLAGSAALGRVPKHCRPRDAGRDLLEWLELLKEIAPRVT